MLETRRHHPLSRIIAAIVIALASTTVFLGGSAIAAAQPAPSGVIDVPVSFTVHNVNDTAVPCAADGGTYTIRGHLTAPAGGVGNAITLYEHGIAAGEWYWRLPVQGYHHTYEMAARGQTSLTIDRLGYDSSDAPPGGAMCVGSQATMAHQIVQALRTGNYQWDASGTAPTFEHITLAGQSNGGQIVQIEAYTFDDVDALVVMDWADRGLTPEAYVRFFAATPRCLTGGSASENNPAVNGYTFYDQGTEEFVTGNYADTEQEVIDEAAPYQNQHPCGDMLSQGPGILLDLVKMSSIDIPVLGLYGQNDARVQFGNEHIESFTGTSDKKAVTIPDAGHYMGHARNAALVFDSLDQWLDARQPR